MKITVNKPYAKFLFVFLLGIVLIGFGSAVGTYPTVDPSMVLYYHFNNNSLGENQTYIIDQSGNGNNATNLNNTIFFNNSLLNDYSFYFNSTNENFLQVSDSNSLDMTNNTSMSFWIYRVTNQSASEFILAKDGGGSVNAWDIEINAQNRISPRFGVGAGPTTTQLLNNQWNNVVITLTRNETNGLLIYINGLLDTTSDIFNKTSNPLTNGLPLRIGARSAFSKATSLNDTFLDEIIIYNRTLSESEVWSNYHNYLGCINVTGQIKTVRGYTKICNEDLNISTSSNLVVLNNTYLNFTGSHFSGGGTNQFLTLSGLTNITIFGLNTTNYTYAIFSQSLANSLLTKMSIDTRANGFMLLNDPINLSITDSFMGGSNNQPTVSGIYIRFSSNNVYMNNLYFTNCTAYNCIQFVHAHGINNTVENSILSGNAGKLLTVANSTNVRINNVTFNNSNNNWDSYNVGLHVFSYYPNSNSTNVSIFNSRFINIGCSAILVQGVDFLNISGVSFEYNQSFSINNRANCAYEAPTAIDLASIWKTWTSDGTETASDNITRTNFFNARNVYINNVSFINYPILLRSSNTFNLNHDLVNYWFRSFATPDYLMPRQDYFISNNFNNLSTTFNQSNNNPVSIRDILGVGYRGSTDSIKVQFKIYNNYLYFENVNLTQNYTTELYNQTNTLIYYSNNSVACSNIATCDGNINITLTPNNYSYVLDNYYLQEGVARQYDPLSISGTSTQKIITSSLSSGITATVIVNSEVCNTVTKITYNSLEWTDGSARSICDSITSGGYELTVDSGSNLLSLEYGTTSFTTRVIYILVGLLAISVLLFAVGGFYIHARDNFDSIKPLEFIKYSMLLLLFTILIIVLINFILSVI